MPPDAPSTMARPLRLLCLFSHRIANLARKLQKPSERDRSSGFAGADLIFPDAPHELPLEDGQDLAMRVWWRSDGSGWDESFALLKSLLEREAPIDGILGFSQGGACASLLAAMHTRGLLDVAVPPRFVVTAGAPSKYMPVVAGISEGRVLFRDAEGPTIELASLHFAGRADDLVPCADSVALGKAFRNAIIIEHEMGHCFPMRAVEVRTCIDFLARMHRELGASGSSPEQASAPIASQQDSAWVQAASPTPKSTPSPFGTARQIHTDEMEALEAIFMQDFRRTSANPPQFRVLLSDLPDSQAYAASGITPSVTITLAATYPEECSVHLEAEDVMLSTEDRPDDIFLNTRRLVEHLSEAARGLVGAEMCFQLIEEAKAWISTARADASQRLQLGSSLASATSSATSGASGNSDEARIEKMTPLDEADDEESVLRHAAYIAEATREANAVALERPIFSGAGQGNWVFTVGLVGKPSAGKSTLFNASTDPDREADCARVAAFPFTTIDPNIGQGYFSAPCPADAFQLPLRPISGGQQHRSDAPKGFAANGERKIGMILKDVAGLVPGAYQGRGRGNAFLNDLCDADVLIHVVDISGKTDAGGNLSERGHDPLLDISWVREELHRWIYNNVQAKWSSIARKPDRFVGMFSGYHCKSDTVYEALDRAGYPLGKFEESLRSWGPRELHRAVAHFLRVRFPILLALNKVDVDGSAVNVERVGKELPHEPHVPVCARLEWQLCQWRRLGLLEYADGASSCSILTDAGSFLALEQHKRDELTRHVAKANEMLQRFGGTGILRAVTEAVSMKAPLVVYPVVDLSSCASLPLTTTTREQRAPLILRDCLIMKRGTTPEDLFNVLKRAPISALAGDYVRAETRDIPGSTRPLRKDEELSEATCVVKVMTNRKSAWQAQQHHHSAATTIPT